MHTRASLERFGAESLIPMGLGMALIKETGPLVTALLFSGRVGAGIGAELGAMRVTEQIDAMRALGTDPVKKLVAPRLVATVVMLFFLTIISDLVGLAGGSAVATMVA